MQIHQTLLPLPEIQGKLRNVIRYGKQLGDGGFSRVIHMNRNRVLKLTCCTPTRKMLGALEKRKAPIKGLPRVYQALGPVAYDADGFVFYGYIVERLYSFEDWQINTKQLHEPKKARQVMRRTNFRKQMSLPDIKRKGDLYRRAMNRMTAIMRQHGTYPEDLGHVRNICQHMPLFTVSRAFDFLFKEVMDSDVEFDLLRRGNVLMTAQGDVCLSDPVTEHFVY